MRAAGWCLHGAKTAASAGSAALQRPGGSPDPGGDACRKPRHGGKHGDQAGECLTGDLEVCDQAYVSGWSHPRVPGCGSASPGMLSRSVVAVYVKGDEKCGGRPRLARVPGPGPRSGAAPSSAARPWRGPRPGNQRSRYRSRPGRCPPRSATSPKGYAPTSSSSTGTQISKANSLRPPRCKISVPEAYFLYIRK